VADSKISALTDGNPALAADIMVVSRAGGFTRRLTLAQLTTLVAAAIIDGGTNEISVNNLNGLLADPQTPLTENVQDIVGAMLTDSATIDFTYNDAGGTETADIKAASVTEAMQVLADLTTQDVTSTKHGYVPKAPADSTKFLDGSATPVFDTVKDSDLSTSDITTNDVSTTKHGFAPKAPSDATKFLNGANPPAWTVPSSSAIVTAYAQDSNGSSYNTNSGEVSLWSFTLVGGDLSTGKRLRITLIGDYLVNSGSCTITLRVKLGATTLWGDVTATITNSAVRRPFYMEFIIANLASASVQSCVGFCFIGSVSVASVAGLGEIAVPGTAILMAGHFRGTATENTATDKVVDITNQFSVSNISDEIVIDHAFAELIA
jgi:hypothetical protein